jgi:glycosyltransferase involved in cell wall biosynthesis
MTNQRKPSSYYAFDTDHELAPSSSSDELDAMEHPSSGAGDAGLYAQLDALRQELALVETSVSWRITQPLRDGAEWLRAWAPLRAVARRHPRVRQAIRRAVWLPPRNLRSRLQRRLARSVGVSPTTSAHQAQPASATAVFLPHAVRSPAPVDSPRDGKKGRLICLTHVLPYPPRAGNEYRIHRMLSWLSRQGWDVLLLVCPPGDSRFNEDQLAELATQYTNFVVCYRDGTLVHQLFDRGVMLEPLRGRTPRAFAALLGEDDKSDPAARDLNDLLHSFCPDAVVELLLHLLARFKPQVLITEYVFMTRPLPLLRSDVLKVVDTHDVFSTKHHKVMRFGIDDGLDIDAGLEAALLNRADLVIAIQPAEALDLKQLVPGREVIEVGVDFPVPDQLSAVPTRPVILVVGSNNLPNIKGLADFLRLAWPTVLAAVPDARLHIVGAIGDEVEPVLPNVQLLGRIDDLDAAYGEARVVINPALAGTGLKIKTVEALCHLRPIVLWPAGADGLSPEVVALCHVADDWFEFAQLVIELVRDDAEVQRLVDGSARLRSLFAADNVYSPLEAALERKATFPLATVAQQRI